MTHLLDIVPYQKGVRRDDDRFCGMCILKDGTEKRIKIPVSLAQDL
jgi:hypothetical protein